MATDSTFNDHNPVTDSDSSDGDEWPEATIVDSNCSLAHLTPEEVDRLNGVGLTEAEKAARKAAYEEHLKCLDEERDKGYKDYWKNLSPEEQAAQLAEAVELGLISEDDSD